MGKPPLPQTTCIVRVWFRNITIPSYVTQYGYATSRKTEAHTMPFGMAQLVANGETLKANVEHAEVVTR